MAADEMAAHNVGTEMITVPGERVCFDVVLKDCKTLRRHSQLHGFIAVILKHTRNLCYSSKQASRTIAQTNRPVHFMFGTRMRPFYRQFQVYQS